jgi:CysZ protein
MNFFKDFFRAIANCFKGFSLLFEKGLWPYLFYPVLVWLAIWAGSVWLFAHLSLTIAEYINEQLDLKNIPDSGSWLSFAKPLLTGWFTTILAWIIKLALWFLWGTASKYITLILLSPLFSLLSEATEEKLKGVTYAFNFTQFINDVFRGIGMSLRNMLLEYAIIALCFLVTLIFPPLFFITTPFLLIVSWYFTGFTMLDYNFERHKMGISLSVGFVRQHRGTACGIGMVYSLCMFLPLFIGLMFGPTLAVIGACISFLELKKQRAEHDTL